MVEAVFENVYGTPPEDLVAVHADATQFSPLMPGAQCLAAVANAAPASPALLSGLALLAPPAAVERRYTIARALRALRRTPRPLRPRPR